MGERELREQVIGLTLQLQKFGIGKIRDKNDTQANTILGHYDHLVIRQVRRWLEYSPRMDWESGENDCPAATLPATHYPIKLLFPWEDGTKRLSGFCYDAWKDHETLLEENPCMTVVLLNLTDAYKDQAGKNLLGAFLGLLRSSCEETLLRDVHCCVLPSLGYSDFCILMAGGSWRPALRLVERLHSLTVPALKGGAEIPVLSTDYMMPVCHPRAGAALREKFSEEYFKGLELLVRVNLYPGVTARQLADSLRDIQVYRTSGGSDCLLWARDGQAQTLCALIGYGERNFVIDMASTLQLQLTSSESALMPDTQTREDPDLDAAKGGCRAFDTEIAKFKTTVQKYAAALRACNRHYRQANALQELTALIEDVCTQPHTGALRNLMNNLIDGFSSCLERCAEGMSRRELDFSEMEEFVGEFSGIVGRFLEDLSRSDCFFMDREKHSHASVSSATSLLIAYNQWLNAFTDAVRTATQEENHSQYSFLVTCGGRDQTQTTNAFYFLRPSVDKDRKDQLYEKLPLVTQMSEMSLFDFSGTILRSFHECMHYVGARRRRDRLSFFLQFVISLLSLRISSALLDKESCKRAEYALVQLGGSPELLKNARLAYNESLKKLTDSIVLRLWSYFPEAEQIDWDEETYLSKNVQSWAYERLMVAFSGYELQIEENEPPKLYQNHFADGIYQSALEAQEAFRRRCDELCRTYHIPTVVFDFSAQRLNELRNMDCSFSPGADAMLRCQVQMILARLLISQPAKGMPVQSDGAEKELYEAWNRKFPYVMLAQYNMANVLQGAVDIFSESFADVTACTILNVCLEDYLLMHVYEEWDLDNALSQNEMSMAYRIPAVLRLCFRDSLESDGSSLTIKARERVRAAIARLEAHGMPDNRLDADSLCKRINELLQLFAEVEETGEPLLRYLSICRQDYQSPKVQESMRKFSDSFQKIRLSAVNPEGEDLHKNLVEMYNALYNGWRGEDGGKKDYL